MFLSPTCITPLISSVIVSAIRAHYHPIPIFQPLCLRSLNCFIWSFNSCYTLQCHVNLGNGQTINPRSTCMGYWILNLKPRYLILAIHKTWSLMTIALVVFQICIMLMHKFSTCLIMWFKVQVIFGLAINKDIWCWSIKLFVRNGNEKSK